MGNLIVIFGGMVMLGVVVLGLLFLPNKKKDEKPTDAQQAGSVMEKEAVPLKSIKILAIGNSFSSDAVAYLWDIYKAAGYEEVIIGNLYIGGCSLDTHLQNMQENAPNYQYWTNTLGQWMSWNGQTASHAIAEHDWDVITIQQASHDSGVSSTYQNLNQIVGYINTHKTNPDAKIYWHMTWAYQADSNHYAFGPVYQNDQAGMYESIVKATQSNVLDCGIAGVIPSGTAIQNMRNSQIGDILTRDGYHLSYDLGRYTAALTWYAALSGKSIDDITWVPTISMMPPLHTDTWSQADQYGANITANMDIIKESVKNAVDNPFVVTPSALQN